MFDILPLGHSHSLQKPQMILCVPFIHSSVRRFLWLLFWEPSVKNKAQGVLKNTLPLFHPCLSSCGILSFSPCFFLFTMLLLIVFLIPFSLYYLQNHDRSLIGYRALQGLRLINQVFEQRKTQEMRKLTLERCCATLLFDHMLC